jgi:hypothetical protein
MRSIILFAILALGSTSFATQMTDPGVEKQVISLKKVLSFTTSSCEVKNVCAYDAPPGEPVQCAKTCDCGVGYNEIHAQVLKLYPQASKIHIDVQDNKLEACLQEHSATATVYYSREI